MIPFSISTSLPASPERIKSSLTQLLKYQKQLLKDRFLKAYLSGDKMILKYKTRGGYFIRASFNAKGICIMKEYFKNYDKKTGKLWDYLFTRRIELLFG